MEDTPMPKKRRSPWIWISAVPAVVSIGLLHERWCRPTVVSPSQWTSSSNAARRDPADAVHKHDLGAPDVAK
jgi:hypothetical protein